MKITYSIFITISLSILFPPQIHAQWNLFTAKKFNSPSDSSDIYQAIEEKFGPKKRKEVKTLLTKEIYFNKFDTYLKGKNATEVVELLNHVKKEIDEFRSYKNSYKAIIKYNEDAKPTFESEYILKFKSLFKKIIQELNISIYIYEYRKNPIGMLKISKKNLTVEPNQSIEIWINKTQLMKKTQGRKKFRYTVNLNEVGFTDFTSESENKFDRALDFMTAKELKEISQKKVISNK